MPCSRRRSRRLVVFLLVTATVLSVPPASSESSPPHPGQGARAASAPAPTPTFLPGFSSVQRWHLQAAFDTALRKLSRREACRALFDGLELGALDALAGTLYEPARGSLAKARCQGPVVALTVVSGRRTRLCEPFQRLALNEKASTLLHEALHRAGLRESPPDPDALTARQVKTMVNAACGL